MPKVPYLRLAIVSLAIGAVIAVLMVQIDWNGEAGSTAAGPIDTLLDWMIVVSSFVFAIVCVFLGYALYRWRVKPGDESDGLPIHGNTKLELVWTIIPTVIVLFAAGYSWAVLDDIEEVDSDPLIVNVYSQQFAWTFGYPTEGNKWSEGEFHVPVGRQVVFNMHAQDVLHSFWVPEWRIKKDNVPGITTDAVVTPDRVGTFQLICTELCGAGHSVMRAKVVVEPVKKFNRWVKRLDEKVPTGLILTADQALEIQRQIQKAENGIGGSGVDETTRDNVTQS
ncbi:MAG: cytochrome c oxidase subunit II [Solirubrobacterales bacterium]